MVPPIVGKYNQYNSYTLPIGRPALESLPLRLCSQVILSPVKLTIKSNYRYIVKKQKGFLGQFQSCPVC